MKREMQKKATLIWLPAALSLVLAACFAEPPDVYNCSKEKPGCPEGYTCNPGTWICVKDGILLATSAPAQAAA